MKHLTQYQNKEFYLAGLIKRQVEQESWVDWARKPSEDIPTWNSIPELTLTLKQAILRGVSILMP